MLSTLLKWLTGGVLDRVLSSVDKSIDNETERQKVRAEVIRRHIELESEGRIAAMQHAWFWRVWALFAVPLGAWWALVMIDTALPFVTWEIPDLPLSVKPWANTIFQSLFGSGAAVGAAQAIGNAIRGRK